MTEGDLKNIVGAIYKARGEGDLEALMAFVDPECCFRIVGSDRLAPITTKTTGQQSVHAAFKALFENWDMAEVETTSLHVEGDTAYAHRSGRIRFIPTETWIETEFLDKLTFRNGRVTDLAEFVDTLLVAETVGIVGR